MGYKLLKVGQMVVAKKSTQICTIDEPGIVLNMLGFMPGILFEDGGWDYFDQAEIELFLDVKDVFSEPHRTYQFFNVIRQAELYHEGYFDSAWRLVK